LFLQEALYTHTSKIIFNCLSIKDDSSKSTEGSIFFNSISGIRLFAVQFF
jgi:hypothetical protein